MCILEQMAGWTEEGFYSSRGSSGSAPSWGTVVSVDGVPWVTALLLATCLGLLGAAGGFTAGLSLARLLVFGAKATSLIFDRGETWRLLAANFLHKDALHLACNAFVLWNVGGALERAVRPADYLAMIVFAALGTTLASAVGADSVSLGASGLAFAVLGASASFGWRRGVRGSLRSHFGLRLLPWLVALFAVGLGSSGVDNWGHAGGLVVGLLMGFFLEPRPSLSAAPSRRLAGALGAAAAALAIGAIAAPFLPMLGSVRPGPADLGVRVPIGWRRAGEGADRISFTNGLSAGFRSTATVWVGEPRGPLACKGDACVCHDVHDLVRGLVESDLWRLLDSGALTNLHLVTRPEKGRLGGLPATRLEGLLTATEGNARLSAVCALSPTLGSPVAVIALEPMDDPGRLAERIAEGLELPQPLPDVPTGNAAKDAATAAPQAVLGGAPALPRPPLVAFSNPGRLARAAHSRQVPSGDRSTRRMSAVPRLSRPARGQGLSASPALSDTKA